MNKNDQISQVVPNIPNSTVIRKNVLNKYYSECFAKCNYGISNRIKNRTLNLLKQYGFAIIPKGTFLFRSGEIKNESLGVFFALHKQWAISFGASDSKIKRGYQLKNDLQVLFAINRFEWNGFAISALPEIYINNIDKNFEGDAVYLKFDNHETRGKLFYYLPSQHLKGVITSIENHGPLEIILFQDVAENLIEVPWNSIPDDYNSAEFVDFYIPERLIIESITIFSKNKDYLINMVKDRENKKFYGIFEKVFLSMLNE